jgi:hypothetical protein
LSATVVLPWLVCSSDGAACAEALEEAVLDVLLGDWVIVIPLWWIGVDEIGPDGPTGGERG